MRSARVHLGTTPGSPGPGERRPGEPTGSEPVPAGSVPSLVLDNRRAPCAIGLIRAAREVAPLPSGTELQIWSKDRFAPMEIPLWAERDGHEVLAHERAGLWPWRYHVFTLRRG